jgi:hypothetical protein
MNVGTFQSPTARDGERARDEWMLRARLSWLPCRQRRAIERARDAWRRALYAERRWIDCQASCDTDADEPDELTAETIVLWIDNSETRFGDLMIQDRKTVEWDADKRRWVGGYPW